MRKLIIVLVVDSFADKSNGTSMTAYRFAQALKEKGHQVRIVAPHIDGDGYYNIPERYIPLVTEISHKQHMIFGKPIKKVLMEAFEGADVVHLFLPFKLEIVAMKIAQKMKIPYMAAFHLQPEHITYNIKLQKLGILNKFIFWLFKFRFYRHIHHIHCPSKLIADEINKNGYKAKKYIISNGFDKIYSPPINKPIGDGFIHISMVGRYSNEKRQDILIKAIAHSRYVSKIKLHLKGIGPTEKKLQELARMLPNEVDFGFVSSNELLKILHKTDIYVHSADVEGEAIACLEAISCGVVPIISDSRVSATGQFALDNRSLFEAGNWKDLTQKIDYWIENQDEREKMGKIYAQSASNYTLDKSIAKAEKMYQEVIEYFNK
ncbi:glycosyltransferase [Helicobacter cappadocius]|uniref:Glycosyltransferase n=1 Tax=Helicobacter cappadocius TaxID=3063998 RepID=A0AA90PT75_9HELI|nr:MULTISPECIES: glycosyltransferase [unclassified Helicobacter]MDO7252433.1 glycosyltransferase [Helicobacter sp. faydin-H75]MDP2538300.1 glycosyltransferase [Helicobacter sp. faydin-H76]